MDNSTSEHSFPNLSRYTPASLSEIYDYITVLISGAPKFIDKFGDFPDQNIDSVFAVLDQAFDRVRDKLGEERYASLIDLAARMKALFAAYPDDNNGKTDQGYKLIWEMEEVIQAARRGRVKAKLPDEEGEITGD